jgi:hypothetical protein
MFLRHLPDEMCASEPSNAGQRSGEPGFATFALFAVKGFYRKGGKKRRKATAHELRANQSIALALKLNHSRRS